MSSFTGRRNTGKASSIGRGFLSALDAVGTALADGPKYSRINEIEELVIDLLQERDHLIAGLIEPGNLTVSEDYDPRWRKSAVIVTTSTTDGRLTECKGSWRDNDRFDDSHPGCPYRGTRHIRHEFTLRD